MNETKKLGYRRCDKCGKKAVCRIYVYRQKETDARVQELACLDLCHKEYQKLAKILFEEFGSD